jgi:hypothetical protein
MLDREDRSWIGREEFLDRHPRVNLRQVDTQYAVIRSSAHVVRRAVLVVAQLASDLGLWEMADGTVVLHRRRREFAFGHFA